MVNHETHMQRALDIAALTRGRTSPNPMVGAVIVKNGNVIAEGWHEKTGCPHAEIIALNKAGEMAHGADIYVTLEPCSHYGRTGPCADALIAAGIKKVFVATRDPNPLVAGQGMGKLKQAGILVEEGLLQAKAIKLNEVFFKWIQNKEPFVVVKYAMTLDGKIASKTGESKWITGEKSRRFVHELRNAYDVILAGVGTVIADDPELTCRIENGRNPVRVILDSKARIPLPSKLLHDGQAKTIVVVTEAAKKESIQKLQQSSKAEILQIPSLNSQVNLKELLKYLGENNLTSVLVEGGGEVNASFFEAGLADKVHVFTAPKIIGGRAAKGPVSGDGFDKMSDAVTLKNIEFQCFDDDIMLTGYVRKEKN